MGIREKAKRRLIISIIKVFIAMSLKALIYKKRFNDYYMVCVGRDGTIYCERKMEYSFYLYPITQPLAHIIHIRNINLKRALKVSLASFKIIVDGFFKDEIKDNR